MAYKAVMKPVEGTILTVAKDAAKKSGRLGQRRNRYYFGHGGRY